MKRITLFFVALWSVVAVFAATFSGNLYLTPHPEWLKDSARFAAYMFSGENNIWVDLALSEQTGVYQMSVPEGSWENVIFCRMNPNVTENGWEKGDGKPFWGGQTQDLVPVEGKNHFIIDASADAWNKPDGSWIVFGSEVPDVNPDPDPDPSYISSVPDQCGDIMIQSFYWDSDNTKKAKYGDSRWVTLTAQASELAAYFDLVWLSPSSKSGGGLGYHPECWSDQNSSLGNEKQLRTLIDRLHAGGAKVIADIVVNHRGGKSGWCDFYADDFGEFGRFQFTGAHICKDDEVNFDPDSDAKGKATGANDTGEKYAAARDLDHTNPYVRDAIKAYLKWLQKEFEYDGFRYDVAKGFAAKYFGEYNRDSKVPFSVGEFLDGNVGLLKGWIDGTGKNSMAFDFGTKFNGFNQMANGNYAALKGAGLLGAGYAKYAVTLIDNHDTFERANGNDFAPITDKKKILQANAYLLSMPGVPCVFYPHWAEYKDEIKPMIEARRACGIHSESHVHDEVVNKDKYEAAIDGKNGVLIVKVGPAASVDVVPDGFRKAASGEGYAIFIKTDVIPTPRLIVSPEGGVYEGGVEVSLSSTNENSKIFYTLDGSEPSVSSTLYSKPISITKDSTILKAFAVLDTEKSEVQTNLYLTKKPVRTEGIKVSFYKPDAWESVFLWAWDDEGNNLYGGDKWPGKAITDEGSGWWSYTFPIEILSANVIFNNGIDGAKCQQTGDMVGVEESTCYYFIDHKAKAGISPDCKTVSVDDLVSKENIIIFPNPARDLIFVESNSIIDCIFIYNSTGALVFFSDTDASEFQIGVSDFVNGLYFTRCRLADGSVVTSKFIKH